MGACGYWAGMPGGVGPPGWMHWWFRPGGSLLPEAYCGSYRKDGHLLKDVDKVVRPFKVAIQG